MSVVLLLVIGLAACSAPGSVPPSPEDSIASNPSRPTSGEWEVLFEDGSTASFRAYGGDTFPTAEWVVDGDALRTVGDARIDLISVDTYADFELQFEWRVEAGGNGGVMYRVAETHDPAWMSGPEYQILDNAGHPDGRRGETSAAALYDLIAPAADAVVAPVSAYNVARIVVRDGHVEHWLNGTLAVEYDWADATIRRLIADSKFRDMPGFMAEGAGHIVLQHHALDAWYRNIRIRRLGTT